MKKAITLGAITAIAGVGAATAIGLYAYQKHNYTSKLLRAHLSEINEQLNGLPSFDDDMSDEAFIEYVNEKVEDHGEALVDVVIEKVKTDLDKVGSNFNAQIKQIIDDHGSALADTDAAIKLYKDETTRHREAIDQQLSQYQNGFIGDHDLNYYKNSIDAKLGISQFTEFKKIIEDTQNSSTDSIDTLHTNIKTLTNDFKDTSKQITDTLTLININNGDMKTKYETFRTDFDTFNNATTGQVKLLKDDLSAYFTAHTDLKDYSDDIAFKLDSEVGKINTLIGKKAVSGAAGVGLIGDIEKINTEIASNNLDIDEIRSFKSKMEGSVKQINISMDSLNGIIDTVEESIQVNKDTNDAAWTNLSNQFTTFKNNFETTIAINQDATKSSLEDLTGQFVAVSEKTTNLQVDMEYISEELENAKILFGNIDGVVSTNQADIDFINRTLSEMNLQLQQWTSSIGVNSADITGITTRLNQLDPKVESLRSAVNAQSESIIIIENAIQNTETIVANILEQLDELTIDATDDEVTLYSLTGRVDNLQSRGYSRVLYEAAPGFDINNNTTHIVGRSFLTLPSSSDEWSFLTINLLKKYNGTFATSFVFAVPKNIKQHGINEYRASFWKDSHYVQYYQVSQFGSWFLIKYEYSTNSLSVENIGTPVITQVVASMR